MFLFPSSRKLNFSCYMLNYIMVLFGGAFILVYSLEVIYSRNKLLLGIFYYLKLSSVVVGLYILFQQSQLLHFQIKLETLKSLI